MPSPPSTSTTPRPRPTRAEDAPRPHSPCGARVPLRTHGAVPGSVSKRQHGGSRNPSAPNTQPLRCDTGEETGTPGTASAIFQPSGPAGCPAGDTARECPPFSPAHQPEKGGRGIAAGSAAPHRCWHLPREGGRPGGAVPEPTEDTPASTAHPAAPQPRTLTRSPGPWQGSCSGTTASRRCSGAGRNRRARPGPAPGPPRCPGPPRAPCRRCPRR